MILLLPIQMPINEMLNLVYLFMDSLNHLYNLSLIPVFFPIKY